MSALDDLIAQVGDPALRARLEAEARRVLSEKKFGLVFEEHLPDNTLLPGVSVRRGGFVVRRGQEGEGLFRVLRVSGGKALCVGASANPAAVGDGRPSECVALEVPLADLVTVARPGEPIYPCLEEMARIERGGPDAPWHALIEAENAHALQYLQYVYGKKVDCIYLDPPYNTGARDWKYNNDYVDQNDSWRHSKWLSMMKRRLRLAKKLLNPADSVLIVTIDEKEYLHLGCLLEEMFPEARIQMVSTMINPAVVARGGEFGRCGEYIFFVMFGDSAPLRVKLDREWVSSRGRTHTGNIRWDLLKRSGTNAQREDRPNMFYPIYISHANNRIVRVGSPLPLGRSVEESISVFSDVTALWPIRENGSEGCWQWSPESVVDGLQKGRVRVGGNAQRGYTIYILKDGEFRKIQNGEFTVCGRGVNNEIIVEDIGTEQVLATPGDIWKATSHDATQYGSRLLGNIFGGKRFSFPKSLYAVHDAIRFFVANKPNALILDFFAGSGTTLHAVNLLNDEDGGRRRCVMVTNNELSETEAKEMRARGLYPGDDEWEALGIARHVTWPRTRCSIEGVDVRGEPLKGEYLGSGRKMAEGFKANASFFKLSFLDKDSVALGRALEALLPTLWMKAGAHGPPPTRAEGAEDGVSAFPENRFAVLTDERGMERLKEVVGEGWTAFLTTDDGMAFRAMAGALGEGVRCVQLYRDYLDNFRINRERE